MRVFCDGCGEEYDDVDHFTICPHEYFPMHTVAMNAKGETKVCTSLEELDEHMKRDTI